VVLKVWNSRCLKFQKSTGRLCNRPKTTVLRGTSLCVRLDYVPTQRAFSMTRSSEEALVGNRSWRESCFSGPHLRMLRISGHFALSSMRELGSNTKEPLTTMCDAHCRRWFPLFANSLGGVLIIGVNALDGVPQNRIEGFTPPEEELPLTVENLCIQGIKFDPPKHGQSTYGIPSSRRRYRPW